jgi:hypothetical protein
VEVLELRLGHVWVLSWRLEWVLMTAVVWLAKLVGRVNAAWPGTQTSANLTPSEMGVNLCVENLLLVATGGFAAMRAWTLKRLVGQECSLDALVCPRSHWTPEKRFRLH